MTTRIYKVIELIGTSQVSWEDAAKNAVDIASKSLSDLRIVEINKLDMQVEDGKVVMYRARINVSFQYEPREAWDYKTDFSIEKK